MTKTRIGIIGGGASGALAALHCGERLGSAAELVIFEPGAVLGQGKAYSVTSLDYLLNVPAEKMSAFPARPHDFLAWLEENVPGIAQTPHWPFVPRLYFGQYLEQRLAPLSVRHVRVAAAKVSVQGKGYRIHLQSGSSKDAENAEDVDHLIIATGYEPALSPHFADKLGSLRSRVLQPEEVDTHALSGSVLIIGAGLTAIDLWRRIERIPELKATFLSRRGLLPVSHEPAPQTTAIPPLAGLTPLRVLERVRECQRTVPLSWAAVADQVRLQTRQIWSKWSETDKAQFLRHIWVYWEAIRHRVPATVHRQLMDSMAEGRLRVVSGRIREVKEADGRIELSYRERGSGSMQTLRVDWILLATGSPIEQSLLEKSKLPGLQSSRLGLGMINEGAPGLWIVGPASKAAYWEVTAVPDIREQAATVAELIARDAEGESAS